MKINNILLKKKNSGFTLLELIVVIAIIAILAVIALPSFTSALRKARDGRRIADMRTVQTEIAAFTAQQQSSYYPDGLATSTLTFNNNNQVTLDRATTTLAAIYRTQGKPVPAAVTNGDVGYAVYGCTGTLPVAVVTSVSFNGLCSNYVIYTQLEDGSNSTLKSSATTSIGLSSGTHLNVLAFTN
ncbi:MAG: prepilin-type N-terminal cleavage/methylation domain-containing protein [Cyanobium sp. MAG06]|nr:prepilin-type N-terminal cleavage/methylation domain-containing protein [Cyanobium sp. MAG06]